MNTIQGHICDIQVSANLSMISVQIHANTVWKTLVVETPDTASYLQIGNAITLLFKETEVIIAKEKYQAISIENDVEGVISAIEKGQLLSKLTVHTGIGDIFSILATEALDRLLLEEQQSVIVMIQMNEIMLSQ